MCSFFSKKHYNINVRILFSVLFIILSACCACMAQTQWIRIAPNNYVDENAIVGLEDRYGFSFLLKAFNKGQYEPINDRQIYYTLAQYEIDCAKNTYKIGVIDSYDEDDIFVNGDYNKYAEFQPIVKDTAVSVLAKRLCRP